MLPNKIKKRRFQRVCRQSVWSNRLGLGLGFLTLRGDQKQPGEVGTSSTRPSQSSSLPLHRVAHVCSQLSSHSTNGISSARALQSSRQLGKQDSSNSARCPGSKTGSIVTVLRQAPKRPSAPQVRMPALHSPIENEHDRVAPVEQLQPSSTIPSQSSSSRLSQTSGSLPCV